MQTRSLAASLTRFARQAHRRASERAGDLLRSIAAKPTFVLMQYFVRKAFINGEQSADTQSSLGIGGILGLLMFPGALLSFMLFDKYSSLMRFLRQQAASDIYTISLPDKYFFIVFSMAITGIVTVLRWDRILPDHQDHLNLAPLPISTHTILTANASAIGVLVLVFAVDVNAASMVLFPLVVTAEQGSIRVFLEFTLAHAVCVLLASIFTFCAIFSILGVLLAALPRRIFGPISLLVRSVIVVSLLTLLVTVFAGPGLSRSPSASYYLPSIWYLGLYQTLQQRGDALLQAAAVRAWWGTALSLIAAFAIYALTYRKTFLSTGSVNRGSVSSCGWLAFGAGRTPFQKACSGFTLRALLRSESHYLCVAAFAGLGLVMAAQAAVQGYSRIPQDGSPDWAFLSIPLIVVYLLLWGIRIAFELPLNIKANWVFRTVLDHREHEAASTGRLVMIGCAASIVWLPALIGSILAWGIAIGFMHTIFVMCMSLLLIELLLHNYRKIPTTCASPAFRNNTLMITVIALFGLSVFSQLGARIERWMFQEPVRFAFMLLPVLALLHWRLRTSEDDGPVGRELIFDDKDRSELESLNLSPVE